MLRELDLQITNRCMLNCKHCCCTSTRQEPFGASIEKWGEVVRAAHSLGVRRIDITGGEPYLRKDVPELIGLIESLGIEYEVQSTWIPKRKPEDSHRRISVISMDGMQGWHDYYRGAGSFSRAAAKLRDLAKLPQSRTRVTTVVTSKNKNDIPSLLKLTGSNAVDHHAFFCFSPIGRGREISSHWSNPYEHMEIGSQLEKFIAVTASELPRKISFQVGYSGPNGRWRESIGCRAMGADFLFVLADGRTLPCSWYIDTEFTLGNVFELGLKRVYENYLSHLNVMTKRLPNACRTCNLADLCKGGCDAARLISNAEVDPRCLAPDTFFPGCPEAKVTFCDRR